MNKRITSLLLCFVMVFAMLATAVPAMAATVTSTQLKVTPDKTTASPGDTITYTIKIGPVSDMGSMQMDLDIPTGLTYVENTTELANKLKDTLGFDTVDWTETSKRINGVASAADYESNTDTEIATFKCKVDEGATGSLKVGLTNLEFGSCQTFTEHTDRFSVVTTSVTITAAPKPATGISLNKGAATIYTGNSETLYATVTPADSSDTVTWVSDRTTVATVDGTGKVTAVAPGTAIITAKAGSKTATCTVTVENAPCTHTSKSTVTAKDSDCKNKGWDKYQKCNGCDQLFNASGTEISEIPYRPLSTTHSVGTAATCKKQAVCSVCSKPFGDLAAHDYSKQAQTDAALKDAGNCKKEKVYYYSCSVCDAVERNENHTFNGGKGNHTPADAWSKNETKHWKECADCTVVIESTKADHDFKIVVDKEATATEKGSQHEECRDCGYKKEAVEIPATGTTDSTDSANPTNPVNPSEPADSAKSDNKTESTKTGDNSMMVLWIALLFISGVGVAGTTVLSRKRRSMR